MSSTYLGIKKQFEDFDTWIINKMNELKTEIRVLNIYKNDCLPDINETKALIVTGSHSIVTDKLPCSYKVEKWIPLLIENEIPYLGIYYGHQLLDQALE